MDYEKKYNEALERAKKELDVCGSQDCDAARQIFRLFPELAESEDERIRKGLIENFKWFCGDFPETTKWGKDDDMLVKDIITWLEKQGESIRIKKGKNYLCTKTHKYAGMEWIEGVKYYSPEDYSLVNQGCTCYCPKYSKEEHNNFFKEVEYDGCLEVDKLEPKFKVKYAVGEYNVVDEKDITGVTYYGIEDEPNHIDYVKADTCEIINAKPKFKVGDWLQYRNAKPFFVEAITKQGYVNGDSCLPFNWENEIHLWTIKDAKDGDVLLFEGYYNSIVLFQGIGINGKGRINYHCKCDLGNYSFGIQGDVACLGTIEKDAENYHPATKEQRNTLFAKMKKAGYEWDAEKKELKKIETKGGEE